MHSLLEIIKELEGISVHFQQVKQYILDLLV